MLFRFISYIYIYSETKLNNKGIEDISNHIQNISSLTVLKLSKTRMTHKGLKFLAEKFHYLPYLRNLDISCIYNK